MNRFSRLAAVVTGAAMALGLAVSPAKAANPYEPENRLIKNLTSYGITVHLQDAATTKECKRFHGLYFPNEGRPHMLICVQDGQWSDFYSMVLRHEAVHAIQDCRDANPHNPSVLKAGMPYLHSRQVAGKSGLDLQKFLHAYRADGADQHTLTLEAEAFVKMHLMTTDQINAEFNEVCWKR